MKEHLLFIDGPLGALSGPYLIVFVTLVVFANLNCVVSFGLETMKKERKRRRDVEDGSIMDEPKIEDVHRMTCTFHAIEENISNATPVNRIFTYLSMLSLEPHRMPILQADKID